MRIYFSLHRKGEGAFKQGIVRMKNGLLVALTVFLLSSCATVNYDYALPPQDINAPTEQGKVRVVFFNDTNPVLFADGSWRIGIKIDGRGVENLHLHKYVQLYLTPGLYVLELSHRDIFLFPSKYDLEVGETTMFVRVFNGITSTKYEVLEQKPEDFLSKYKPAQLKEHQNAFK
jgi:hypothetical protein